MYDKLVKRLRNAAELLSQDIWAAGLFTEAVDAIEELNHKIDSLESEHEISPEAEYAIDKHADNLISHMKELIEGLK